MGQFECVMQMRIDIRFLEKDNAVSFITISMESGDATPLEHPYNFFKEIYSIGTSKKNKKNT